MTNSSLRRYRVSVRDAARQRRHWVDAAGAIAADMPRPAYLLRPYPCGQYTRKEASDLAARLRKTWRVVRLEPIVTARELAAAEEIMRSIANKDARQCTA